MSAEFEPVCLHKEANIEHWINNKNDSIWASLNLFRAFFRNVKYTDCNSMWYVNKYPYSDWECEVGIWKHEDIIENCRVCSTCTCFFHCLCESGHTARRPDVHPNQWAPHAECTVSGWSACTRTRSPASAQLTHSQSPGRENAPRVSAGIQEGYWWALEQTMGNTAWSKKTQQSAKASNSIYLVF